MTPYSGNKIITASDFERLRKRTIVRIAGWTVFISALVTATLICLNGNIIVPVGLFCALILIILAWQVPRSVYYVALAGACLIETYPIQMKDSTTDLIPLFWDINTIVQTYFKLSNFHGLAFSFFELLLIFAGISWLVRGVFDRTLTGNAGVLFVPILLYVCCVFMGILNGLATGGAFNIALFEVRAQFYFLFAYLMAVNTPDRADRHAAALFWISAFAIGLKGLLGTYRFIFTLKGHTIPEIGIGAHEESFFFNCFLFQLVVLKLADIQPKLRTAMLAMLPFVLIANLANERRAATAAIAIALLAMMVLAAVAFPKRRRAIVVTSVLLAAACAVYLPMYWNKTGALAQPARAVKSVFEPDARDQSSDEYRDAENANLMETLKLSPVIGYGYGKPIMLDTPMVDLTSIDPLIHYMTHNQILWVWMRVGTIGFFCFWVMITAIIMQACQILKDPFATVEVKAATLLGVLIIVMQMVFGLLDLQISNVRNMLFCGIWAGTIAFMASTRTRWNLPAPERVRN